MFKRPLTAAVIGCAALLLLGSACGDSQSAEVAAVQGWLDEEIGDTYPDWTVTGCEDTGNFDDNGVKVFACTFEDPSGDFTPTMIKTTIKTAFGGPCMAVEGDSVNLAEC